jgi:uncharacterized membrane protein (DUF485 family)
MADINHRPVPRIVLKSIAGGIILMAGFTFAWINLAITGLRTGRIIWLWGSALFVIFLIADAVYLMLVSRHFPKLTSEADRAKGRIIGKWYGILFGSEGAVIALVCTVLAATGHGNFILPSVALVVGLHFYPMAKLFDRTIDYYIASWTCLIAITAIYLVARGAGHNIIHLLVGFGVAASTAAYASFMLAQGNRALRTRRTVEITHDVAEPANP